MKINTLVFVFLFVGCTLGQLGFESSLIKPRVQTSPFDSDPLPCAGRVLVDRTKLSSCKPCFNFTTLFFNILFIS